MPTYYSYYLSLGKDPSTKYEVGIKEITKYTKDGMFPTFLQSWKKSDVYELTPDVEIAFDRIEQSGSGVLALRKPNTNIDGKFPIYRNCQDFINEVKQSLNLNKRTSV